MRGKPKAILRTGWVDGKVGFIPLTKGQVALVDAHRLPELTKWNWCAAWVKHTKSYMALRTVREGDKKSTLTMHRQILGLAHGDPRQGDHKNHDTLDNRDENLRIATHAQNQLNRRCFAKTRSGAKGVILSDGCKSSWQVHISIDGKQICLGSFKTKEEARDAYANSAHEHHGEFACASDSTAPSPHIKRNEGEYFE